MWLYILRDSELIVMQCHSLRGIPLYQSHTWLAIRDKAWHVWWHLSDLRSQSKRLERSAAVPLWRPEGSVCTAAGGGDKMRRWSYAGFCWFISVSHKCTVNLKNEHNDVLRLAQCGLSNVWKTWVFTRQIWSDHLMSGFCIMGNVGSGPSEVMKPIQDISASVSFIFQYFLNILIICAAITDVPL